MFYHDPTFLLIIPAFILALFAQWHVKSTYEKYSKVRANSGYTGARTAREILNMQGLGSISVVEHEGFMTDHYDPIKKVIRLSPEVYHGASIASIGVAAHEAGHAVQHSKFYLPLVVRNGIFPIASFGSWLAFPLFFIGLMFRSPAMMDIGIIIFSGVVLFQVVTLPVEYNASSRAISLLSLTGILSKDEVSPARKVLSAAALTYLAATAVSLMHLVRLLILRQERR